MKMSDTNNMSEVEASVLGQCLEFTSNVIKNNKSFSIHLKMSNGFTFNFCNTEKRNSLLKDSKLKKKPSPSTLAQNKIRMEKFIAKKKASAPNTNSETSTDKDTTNVTLKDSDAIATSIYKCDLCDYENNTKKGLSCHIAQKHKEKQQQGVHSPIPQLDGTSDGIEEPVSEDPKCQFAKGGYSCSEFKLKFEGSTAYGLRPTNDHTACFEAHKKACSGSSL
jgi:hypothetical protein